MVIHVTPLSVRANSVNSLKPIALESSRILSFLKFAKITPSSAFIPTKGSNATGSINSSVMPLSYMLCIYSFGDKEIIGVASTITRYPCSTLSHLLSRSILKKRPEIEAIEIVSLQIRNNCSTKPNPEVGETSLPSVMTCK